MKIAIIFASVHHGNTRKVVEQIAQNNDVDLIDATQEKEKDLSEYDRIGFASHLLWKISSIRVEFCICEFAGI